MVFFYLFSIFIISRCTSTVVRSVRLYTCVRVKYCVQKFTGKNNYTARAMFSEWFFYFYFFIVIRSSAIGINKSSEHKLLLEIDTEKSN